MERSTRLIGILLMTGLAGVQASCAAGPRPLRGPVPLEWRTLVGCYHLTKGPNEWTFVRHTVLRSVSSQYSRTSNPHSRPSV
jgi:hypothetical protein